MFFCSRAHQLSGSHYRATEDLNGHGKVEGNSRVESPHQYQVTKIFYRVGKLL